MKTYWALLVLFAAVSTRAEEVVGAGRNWELWQNHAGWTMASAVTLNPTNDQRFVLTPGEGIYVNGEAGRASYLVTTQSFGDVEVHIEFCLPRHSNAGVYLMGRYEVQIYDSFGVATDKYPGIECGGLYPRYDSKRHEFEGHSPRVNASQPPGTWQSFDIVFQAPRFDAAGHKTAPAKFVTVRHNGVLVHENVEVHGPTRSAATDQEAATGPLRLQGDHGPIAYRNLRIRPRP